MGLLKFLNCWVSATDDSGLDIVKNEHKLLLEALRHREQAMIQYLAILGPALGGFVWLLQHFGYDEGRKKVFVTGTVGVVSILFLGAIYSLALGYNFRYITLELAKIEAMLGIDKFMLVGWPRSAKNFQEKYRFCCMPWCTPPEIIWIFWFAFLVCIAVVTSIACAFRNEMIVRVILGVWGGGCLLCAGIIAPIFYGCKLQEKCKREPAAWRAD